MKTKRLILNVLFILCIFSSCKVDDNVNVLDDQLVLANAQKQQIIEFINKYSNGSSEVFDLINGLNNGRISNEEFRNRISNTPVLDESMLFFTYLGLSIKGSGGGGSFLDGIDVLDKIADTSFNPEIPLVDVSNVDTDDLFIVAGGIGAPTALKADLDGLLQAISLSIDTLKSRSGDYEMGGILAVESGSVNATIALLLSAELGLPLVDADGAGRSVPKLSNLTYAHESYKIAPTVLTSPPNPDYITSVLFPETADDAEEMIRRTLTDPKYGQMGGLALWAQTGDMLQNSQVVRRTFTEATILGVYAFLAAINDVSFLDLYFKTENTLIASYDGTLEGFEVSTEGGFDVTTLTVNLDNDEGTATIKALNENMMMQVMPTIVFDDVLIGGYGSGLKEKLITAPHLLTYVVEVQPGMYVPLNNGDSDLMKHLIGNKIHIVAAYSDDRLYDIDQTFLDVLSSAFGYHGGVVPGRP